MFAPSQPNEIDDGISDLSARRRWGGDSPLIWFRLLGSGPLRSPTLLTLRGGRGKPVGSAHALGNSLPPPVALFPLTPKADSHRCPNL